MKENMKAMVGQCFMGGFPGKEMSSEFIELVKKYNVSNVILFRHNVENEVQLRELCGNIQELIKKETGHPAIISIDQEGGVVTRLPDCCCNVPGAMAIAATGNPQNAKVLAKLTAKELKYLGVNFNLAPVMDINNNVNNPVIGVRSYGDKAETVIDYACAAIEGYIEEGIISCAKHFPGHGDTAVDSHLGLPSVDKSLEELKELELLPFMAGIEKGIPAIMSSHILFPHIEPEQVPCTMSRKIITEVLKEDLGFQGLVVSDCLEMDAIKKFYGTANGALAAMRAGIDLVIVSHTSALLEEALELVHAGIESGELSEEKVVESAEKVLAYKAKYCQDAVLECDIEGDKAIEREIRKETFVLVEGEIFELGQQPYFVGPSDFRVTQASNKEAADQTFADYMAQELGGIPLLITKDPDEKEIKEISGKVLDATSIVIATYNGHLMRGQIELVKELEKKADKVALVALRNPYDLTQITSQMTKMAVWDYSTVTLELLAQVWKSQEMLTGVMPVRI